MRKVSRLLLALLLLSGWALASVSLMTGAVLIGAERLPSASAEARALERAIGSALLGTSLICYFQEHHRYDGGLTYLRASSLMTSLESAGWRVEELMAFSPLLERMGLWLAQRRGEQVLVFLFPLSGVGYVSFCQVR